MDLEKAGLVIFITLVIVIAFNIAIYRSLRRKQGTGEIELFQHAAGRLRRPWSREEAKYQELSDLVSTLDSQEENENIAELEKPT
jgi:hypothetical protein